MSRRVSERSLIRSLRSGHSKPAPWLKVGLGDDAAVLQPTPGTQTLLTCDLLIEGIHFRLNTTPPWELGAKSLAASLSDLAAMGGLPRAFLISLGVPKGFKGGQPWFGSFYAGLRAWGEAFGAALAGGDTTSSPGPLVIDIFATGEVEKGRALLRSGAGPGDFVCCTGTLGGAAAGLAVLEAPSQARKKVPAGAAALAVKRHRLPLPRLAAGRLLLKERLASSCIDVSDGLASELSHLAEESGVAIEVRAEAVPLAASTLACAAALKKSALDWALHGGEDYELLFTVPESRMARMEHDFGRLSGTPFHVLGRVRRGKGARMLKKGRWQDLSSGGYEHRF